MDAMQLRPRGVGELLDVAFKLYLRSLRPLLAVAAVVLIPLGLLQIVVSTTYGNVGLFEMLVAEPGEIPPGFGRFVGATLMVGLIGGLGNLLVQATSVRVLAGTYQGERTEWRESLVFAARRTPAVVAAAFLAGMGAGLGLLLCIVPGVWLWTSWYVTIPSLLVEDTGPIRAMQRSFNLVKSHFWPVLGVGVLAYLLAAVANQVVGLFVNAAVFTSTFIGMEGGGDPTTGGIFAAASVATTVVSLFTVPFLAAVAVAVYFDLRVRAEGYDLEQMVAELDPDTARPEEG